MSERKYPWTTDVGGKQVTFRLMDQKDREMANVLARELPQDDLLFLTFDITNKQALDYWFSKQEAGKAKTILALAEGKIVGLANLSYNEVHWTRHLGDIWLLVNRSFRERGLGKLLANEVFSLAQELGLKKLVAQMASEQRGAIQVFERLGFKPEALLADHAIDQQNRTHDLVIMSYDITGFTE